MPVLPNEYTEVGYVTSGGASPLLWKQPTAAAIIVGINLMYTQQGFENPQFQRLRVAKVNDITPLSAGNQLFYWYNNAWIALPDGFYYWMGTPYGANTLEGGSKYPAVSYYMQTLSSAFVGITSVPAPPVYAPLQPILAIITGSTTPVHGVASPYSGIPSTGGQASGLSYLWQAVSGSVPTFSGAQGSTTTINFASAGAFVISLTVSDPMRRNQYSTTTFSGTAS